MKPIRLLLASFLLFSATTQAQITITAADMPNVGDTLRLSEATPASAMAYTFSTTGANHNWDFSNLVPASQDVDTFVSVLSTPIYYYPSFITNASIARKGEQFSMASFSLTNVYDFFKETNTSYAQVGVAAQFTGIPLPTLYSSPDYLYRFPLDYGDSDSCLFGYSITIPTLFSLDNQSKRVNRVDGWGTLTTPFGTFQALRVKSVLTSRDSIASDSFPFPIPPTTSLTTEYKWLATGHHTPLLTATVRSLGGTTVTYRDIYRQVNSGIGGFPQNELKPAVFPNPSEGLIRISNLPGAASTTIRYEVFDLSGKLVLQGDEPMAGDGINLDLAGLDGGVYSLRISDGNGSRSSVKVVLF